MRSSRATLAALSKRTGSAAAAFPGAEELSHGWVRVPSRSKPGLYYYAHPATRRTQPDCPEECKKALKAKVAGGAAAVGPSPKPPQGSSAVDVLDSPSPTRIPSKIETPPA
eukprot:3898953-Amphidinium_carterae.1